MNLNIRTFRITMALVVALCATMSLAFIPIVGPQIRIDVNGGTKAANETSAASVGNGMEIVASTNDWRRSSGTTEIINMGVMVSNDGGQTWTDFLVRPPAGNQTNVEGDPMTCYDPRTGTLWVGAIAFGGNGSIYSARKDVGANTFQPSVNIRVGGNLDKGWMAAGPAPGDPNQTRVYCSYNLGTSRSSDMGATWQGPVSTGSGIGFLPRVGPDGNLYVAYWDFGSGVLLRRSTDGGQTFSAPITIATRMDTWGTQDGSRFPGTFRVPPMNYIAVDMNTNVLYCAYFDTTNIVNGQRNVDMYFTKSTNGGLNWSTPQMIPLDNQFIGDQFWPWIEVDDRGRIHMCYWDSSNVQQNDGVLNGLFDCYYAYSDDEGATWRRFRLTPSSFSSQNYGLPRGNSQFLGDYNALGFGGKRAYPVYVSTQAGDPDTFTHIVRDIDILPNVVRILRGQFVGGNVRALFNDDAKRYDVRARVPFAAADPSVLIELEGVSPIQNPARLRFHLQGLCNGTPLNRIDQVILFRNFQNGTWEEVSRQNPTGSDGDVFIDIQANAARFVEPGTRKLLARVGWFDRGAATPNWLTSTDVGVWTTD